MVGKEGGRIHFNRRLPTSPASFTGFNLAVIIAMKEEKKLFISDSNGFRERQSLKSPFTGKASRRSSEYF